MIIYFNVNALLREEGKRKGRQKPAQTWMNGNKLGCWNRGLRVHKDRKVIVCEGKILECRLFVLEMIFRDEL